MRRPHGYAVWTDPLAAGGDKERDTITCAHCNRIVVVEPRQDPSEVGGFCRMCYRHLCNPCTDLGICTPFERKLEAVERAARFHETVGTVTW